MGLRTHLLEDNDVAYVHPSDIGSAMLCGQRPIQRHMAGSVPTFGEQLLFGQELHAMANDVLTGKQTVAGVQTKAYLEKELVRLVEEDFGVSMDLIPTEDIPPLFEELRHAIQTWSQDFLKVYGETLKDIVAVEETLEVELGVLRDGRTLKLRGTPDLVNPLNIIDWKSSGREWKPAKSQFSLQPDLYRHLVRSNYDGTDPKGFMFFIYVRNKGEWQFAVTSRTEKQIEASLYKTWYYANGIYDGSLPATPVVTGGFPEKRGWYCSAKWCDQWNICPYKYLADDVDESEVKQITWKHNNGI